MIDVSGRWVLVTGSARGIGRLLALELAKHGANLILHSRDTAHTADLEKQIKSAGNKCVSVSCDLADSEDVQKMMKRLESYDIDIVYNNAGYQVKYRPDVFDTPYEDYDYSFRINTIAPMIICYDLFPKMKERGFGRIVNTTSGIDKDPHQGPYSAAKAALDKVTKDLCTLIGDDDIVITLTDPGWCRTDLGGPNAPNTPESAVAGCVAPGLVSRCESGRIIHSQDFAGKSVEEIVAELEK